MQPSRVAAILQLHFVCWPAELVSISPGNCISVNSGGFTVSIEM